MDFLAFAQVRTLPSSAGAGVGGGDAGFRGCAARPGAMQKSCVVQTLLHGRVAKPSADLQRGVEPGAISKRSSPSRRVICASPPAAKNSSKPSAAPSPATPSSPRPCRPRPRRIPSPRHRPVPRRSDEPEAPRLTDRETEVLRLVAKGLSYKQIAERLVISHRTVQNHASARAAAWRFTFSGCRGIPSRVGLWGGR
jgi:predicted DNA-binding protein (UPF0251 family)